MKDIIEELQAVSRSVSAGKVPAGEGQMVALHRTYRADIEDVWDAITNPERISRWFLPISGEFRVGGHYQLEGNAGGEILRCERPRLLQATWLSGDAPAGTSEVEVRLSQVGDDQTELVLEHTAIVPPEMWDQYGPGAVGVGWELALLGLSWYLASGAGMSNEDREAFEKSAQARELMTGSADGWRIAHEASGASAEAAAAAATNTIGFYVPPAE
jgi:uncharacterized protein YndB with AHSA1/START domain